MKKGREIHRGSMGTAPRETLKRIRNFVPLHVDMVDEFCWGTVWDQPGLDRKTSSLIAIAIATAEDNSKEVGLHTRGALNHGATQEEIIQVIMQCTPYLGIPRANHAYLAAPDVFEHWDEREDWRSA